MAEMKQHTGVKKGQKYHRNDTRGVGPHVLTIEKVDREKGIAFYKNARGILIGSKAENFGAKHQKGFTLVVEPEPAPLPTQSPMPATE
jgi:hypothetical protein